MLLPVMPPAATLAPLSLAYHTNIRVQASSIPKPGTLQAGDLLLCCTTHTNTGAIGSITPSGFTNIASAYYDASGSNSHYRTTLSYRLATASEGSSWAIPENCDAAVAVLRPNRAIQSVIANAIQTSTVRDTSSGGKAPDYNATPAAAARPYVFLSALRSRYAINYGPASSSYPSYPPDGTFMRDCANMTPAAAFRVTSRVPAQPDYSIQQGGIIQGYIGTTSQALKVTHASERANCPIECYLTFT